jgi:hypothetical protein
MRERFRIQNRCRVRPADSDAGAPRGSAITTSVASRMQESNMTGVEPAAATTPG